MSPPPLHVVFAGGATGGHVFPALAVAQQLAARAPRARLTFVGTGRAFEREQVARSGLDYVAIPSRPFPRRAREAWHFLADNLAGYYWARWLLRSERVSLVVGLGGFASAAVSRAAARRCVPLVLLESNAVAGRVTRWLAPKAAAVCTAFEETRASLRPGCNVLQTGTPVRREIVAAARGRGRIVGERRPQLLVLGGSGGAGPLNEHAPRALYKARQALAGWTVLHQTGARDSGRTAELYRKLAVDARAVAFVGDVAAALAQSELVITRAGGSALAEVSAAAAAAIVVPLGTSADDHQRANAQALAARGACRVVDERDGRQRFDERLAEQVVRLARDARARQTLRRAAWRASRPDAADEVAELIVELAARPSVCRA